MLKLLNWWDVSPEGIEATEKQVKKLCICKDTLPWRVCKEISFIFQEPENTGASEKTLDVSANIHKAQYI